MTGFPTLPPEHRRRSLLLGLLLLATLGLGLGYAVYLSCDSGCTAAVATPCSSSTVAEVPEEAPCPSSQPEETHHQAEKARAAAEQHHADEALSDMPCSGSLGDWGAAAADPVAEDANEPLAAGSVKETALAE